MASVKLRGIRKEYQSAGRALVVVHDLDLDVADGEFVVLLGPSGCGKTTTLRMIAGLESISAGELRIGDRVVNDVPPKDRDVAMVFQNYALYPHMNVRDNMAFGLRLRGLWGEEIERRVRTAATALGIDELLDRAPRQLSGGQQQRVALGRAIVREPAVFLFDEPLSNLDARLRVQLRREIARLHRELKAPMIYVTHDQDEAMTLGDRIVVMHQGRVQQSGSPGELYTVPQNAFVAGFIGTPPMNLLEGRLESLTKLRLDGPHSDAPVLDLPAALQIPLGERLTRGVLLGIWPDDVEADVVGGTNAFIVPATVESSEPAGNLLLVTVRVRDSSQDIAARVRSAANGATRPGQNVMLRLPYEKIHIFDRTTGERLR